jgi:hemerythrin
MTPGIPTAAASSIPARRAPMAFWRPDLFTGIPEIDRQHQELFMNVAALQAAALTGDVAVAESLLCYLERYTAEHFATEERVMWEVGYPDLDAHWSLHLGFATELARRKAEHAADPSRASLLVDLCRWMDRWLNEHLLQADTEMARFIRLHAGTASAVP